MKKVGYLVSIICVVLFSCSLRAGLPVTEGLVMHLDAGSITGVADGAAIDTWQDLSSAGNNATQATADNQPVFISSSPNFSGGRSVVRFDGTNDWMTLPSTTCTVGSFTAFAVAQYSHMDNNQYIMAGQDGSGNDRLRFQMDTTISGMDPQFLWRAGSSGWTAIITAADTDVHVFGLTSTVEGFLDGVSIATASNTSTENPTAFNIGSYNRGQKDFFSGDLAELVIYNRVLSAQEIALVTEYLAANTGGSRATNPNPGNGAIGAGISAGTNVEVTLQWDAAADPDNPSQVDPAVKKHYLFMDSPSDPNLSYVTDIEVTDWNTLSASYGPLVLAYDTTYRWQIEEGLDDGKGGVFAPGDPNNYGGATWSFTTLPTIPAITLQPKNTYFEEDDLSVTLTLTAATGFPPLSYQWYKDDVIIAEGADYQGTQANTLVILTPDVNDEGEYYCTVTGDNGGMVESVIAVVKMKRLLAGYRFEQNAEDSLGVNNGTAVGNLAYTSDVVVTFDGQAYAADPNGSNYIALTADAYPNAGFGNGLAEGTILFWVKADSTVTQSVLGAVNTGTATMFQVELPYTNAGIIRLYLRDDDGTVLDCRAADTGVLDGQWHHIAITCQANTGTESTAAIYYDGESIVTATAAALDNLAAWEYPLVLLARNNRETIDEYFSDAVDDLQIYNYIMTQTDIIDAYHAVSGQSVCIDKPAYDLSGDCLVTLDDFVMVASQWLDCGLYPDCP